MACFVTGSIYPCVFAAEAAFDEIIDTTGRDRVLIVELFGHNVQFGYYSKYS